MGLIRINCLLDILLGIHLVHRLKKEGLRIEYLYMDKLIDPLNLVLKLFALSFLSLSLVHHVCSLSLKLNQALSQLIILGPQCFKVLLEESLLLNS
jgi:hypothetical protein